VSRQRHHSYWCRWVELRASSSFPPPYRCQFHRFRPRPLAFWRLLLFHWWAFSSSKPLQTSLQHHSSLQLSDCHHHLSSNSLTAPSSSVALLYFSPFWHLLPLLSGVSSLQNPAPLTPNHQLALIVIGKTKVTVTYFLHLVFHHLQSLVFSSSARLVDMELSTSSPSTRSLDILHHFSSRTYRFLFRFTWNESWFSRVFEELFQLHALLFNCSGSMAVFGTGAGARRWGYRIRGRERHGWMKSTWGGAGFPFVLITRWWYSSLLLMTGADYCIDRSVVCLLWGCWSANNV